MSYFTVGAGGGFKPRPVLVMRKLRCQLHLPFPSPTLFYLSLSLAHNVVVHLVVGVHYAVGGDGAVRALVRAAALVAPPIGKVCPA